MNIIDIIKKYLGEPIKNTAQSFFDDYIKANASFRTKAGLSAKIVRVLHGKGCDFCRKLAGTYRYGEQPENIYARHDNCNCTVECIYDKKHTNDLSKENKDSKQKRIVDSSLENSNDYLITIYNQKHDKIVITNKQFGKKVGKHCEDYGLNPSIKKDRDKLLEIISDIVRKSDECVKGSWREQGVSCDMYIKGEDVVVVNDGKFVTILKGGITNARVKNARRKGL